MIGPKSTQTRVQSNFDYPNLDYNYPNPDYPNPRLSQLRAKQKVQVKVQTSGTISICACAVECSAAIARSNKLGVLKQRSRRLCKA